MRISLVLAAGFSALSFAVSASTLRTQPCSLSDVDAAPAMKDPSLLVLECVSDDPAQAAAAIATLRSWGQRGVDLLCEAHEDFLHAPPGALCTLPGATPAAGDEQVLARLRQAIDTVAQQRDAHASQLFWHTDLDQAKAHAAASGKPILSLRLLGDLDEDRSCANSRFFRSVLYANAEVSSHLREHFVLHWESLRPVPQITIDFGDGRRIERTITGNSIHYVLNEHGEIIDALPGLYGPAAFLRGVQAAENLLHQSRMASDSNQHDELIRQWHAAAADRLERQLQADLRALEGTTGIGASPANVAAAPAMSPNSPAPQVEALAVPAAAIAASKMRAEFRAVEAVVNAPGAIARSSEALDEATWERLAALHAWDAVLDADSIALIRSKTPAQQAQQLAEAKREAELPIEVVLSEFTRSLAMDTVRNEYQLHRAIHQWLADPSSNVRAAENVPQFNQRVYAELFLTPLDDPWMGLAPHDAYVALDGGGLIGR